MRLLDLCCGGGGAAVGYHRAGFDEIIGVDLSPTRLVDLYPFEFHYGDALTFPLDGYDLIHASPPCQLWAPSTHVGGDRANHRDILTPLLARLRQSGTPYVVENVPAAPFLPDVILCGSMFGLDVWRHRFFATSFPVPQPLCRHTRRPVTVTGHSGGPHEQLAEWSAAMGIDWLSMRWLSQAIPPAFTEHIGRAFLAQNLEPFSSTARPAP